MNKIDEQVIDNITKHIEALREQAEMQIAAPKKLVEYPRVENYNFHDRGNSINHGLGLMDEYFFQGSSQASRHFRWENFTKERFDAVMKRFDTAKEEWIKDALEIQKQNENIILHNKIQYDRIKKMMSALGIGEIHTEWSYKTARSSKMTKKETTCGWVTDLKRVLALSDNYQTTLSKIENKRKSVEAYGLKKLKELEEARKEKEREEEKQRKIQELAFLRVKYTPKNSTASGEEILTEILERNKYLHLAHFLQANRNDWTSGYDYAEQGLERFDIECDFDKAVVEELTKIIDEPDWVDGRVFRDCEHNYSVLFSKVKDEDLISDYNKIIEIVGWG
jgi:hypothetical protein